MIDNKYSSVLFCVYLTINILLLSSLSSPVFAQSERSVFRIVLDAGHGGKDPGKVYGGVQEKEIALNLVLLIGKRLKRHKNIDVIYTRKKDEFVNLFRRGKIANKSEADLFVSIHCNAHKSSAHGAETFVLGLNTNSQNFQVAKEENMVIYMEDNYQENYEGYDINSPESIIGITISQEEFLRQSVELASYIQNKFSKDLHRLDRGVKQAGFIVLHQTFMPSILIETGFITNRSERNYLKSRKGRDQISRSISEAIIAYKKIHYDNAPRSRDKLNIYYKVQIMAVGKNIPLSSGNFNGLSNVSVEKTSRLYHYYYGKAGNYQDALQLKKKAKSKKFNDAFIVAYSGSKRISVNRANRLLK